MTTLIGLEVHVELDTHTKLFCGCSRHAEEPNTATCPICLGLPGAKPVVNEKVITSALKLSLALGCEIAHDIIFSRKTYFYPDMAKNYQITQYELPIGKNGHLQLSTSSIDILRIQIEEDPAALVHQGATVLIDYNRSGRPLCEIVTAPQLHSAVEAREFMKRLVTLLHYLGIFSLHSCIIKADANVNIAGCARVEIKNITGFKEIERAIEAEIKRQEMLVAEGKAVLMQETRGWDDAAGKTVFQRSKETETDYGYIIDPDLVPVTLSDEFVTTVRKALPELPYEKALRYREVLGLKQDDAEAIANDYDLAQLFESIKGDPLFAAEWIRREVPRVLNFTKKELYETTIVQRLPVLFDLLARKRITRQTGQQLMEILSQKDIDPLEYIKKEGLEAVIDTGALETLCREIIEKNQSVVTDYTKGNEKSFNFLIGLVMRETRGKADPQTINALLKKLLF